MRAFLLIFGLLAPLRIYCQLPAHYRLESRMMSRAESPGNVKRQQAMVNQAAAMGEDISAAISLPKPHENTETVLAILAVTARDSAGGAIWRVTVDSFARDGGSQTAMLRSLGIGVANPTSLNGATIDFYVKDGKIIGSLRPSPPRESRLVILVSELRALFPSPRALKVGESAIDSTFQDIPTPGQANGNRTRTKTVTHSARRGTDTLDVATTALSQMEAGLTTGFILTATNQEERWIYDSMHTVQQHRATVETAGVVINALSGATVTHTTTISILSRIP